MSKFFTLLIAILGWFTVITQFVLMYENRTTPVPEMIIRFFSFFTILTNILVALYFTYQMLNPKKGSSSKINSPGVLTAITVYITTVGLVYQVALRHVWHPKGLQMLVDELLHTIIPVLVLLYWMRYEDKLKVQWKKIPSYLIYPLCYLAYILIRGGISGFYPYHFINVPDLGWGKTIINICLLFMVFLVLFSIFIGLGKFAAKQKR